MVHTDVAASVVHQHTSLVNANSDGELWLLVGTDSGFEALTAIYYQRIDVTLTPITPPDPVLLERVNSIRAAVLDSATLVTDPLPVISNKEFFQFGPAHTRNPVCVQSGIAAR